MAKVMVQLEVEQATYDLAHGLAKFAADMVKTLGDGFQPIQDAAAIGTAVIADLVPVAGNFAQLNADVKEDVEAFMAAWIKAGLELFKTVNTK